MCALGSFGRLVVNALILTLRKVESLAADIDTLTNANESFKTMAANVATAIISDKAKLESRRRAATAQEEQLAGTRLIQSFIMTNNDGPHNYSRLSALKSSAQHLRAQLEERARHSMDAEALSAAHASRTEELKRDHAQKIEYLRLTYAEEFRTTLEQDARATHQRKTEAVSKELESALAETEQNCKAEVSRASNSRAQRTSKESLITCLFFLYAYYLLACLAMLPSRKSG
eukprot:GHVU01047858.1.p1 GENE.GHVU01047858.1~~GHVU01047858.1.p1  ORF type:complete len:231 (-),score=19.86 GHVU01047858.1:643-1335(-)